jgi:large subunit ribosomal protein L6
MSKLAKKPLSIPEKVQVQITGGKISISGPLGKFLKDIPQGISVKLEGQKITLNKQNNDKQTKMDLGTTYRLVSNMLTGVVTPFKRTLEINGTGYNAKIVQDKLVLSLGYSNPVEMTVPKDLKVNCPKPNIVEIEGPDKQKVGQFASLVRSKRAVEPYNMKGIKYSEEVVKKKAGKTAVTGA